MYGGNEGEELKLCEAYGDTEYEPEDEQEQDVGDDQHSQQASKRQRLDQEPMPSGAGYEGEEMLRRNLPAYESNHCWMGQPQSRNLLS